MNQTNEKPCAAQGPEVKTWRARIGVGPDFPPHAPNDVERAMVAEIAELRTQLAVAAAARRNIEVLVADDGYAVSFQTLGQYRQALLGAASGAARTPGGAA